MNLLFSAILLAAADTGGGATSGTTAWSGCTEGVNNVATLACAIPLFQNVVNAALVFGGTVALFMLIYGGFRMVISGGDAKQAGAARSTITYAIIGLLIVFLSFAILNFIAYITNVNCITQFGSSNGKFENCPQ